MAAQGEVSYSGANCRPIKSEFLGVGLFFKVLTLVWCAALTEHLGARGSPTNTAPSYSTRKPSVSGGSVWGFRLCCTLKAHLQML